MHLTTADGTRYVVQRFDQDRGKATAHLIVDGAIYPASLEWQGCTLVIGDRTFNDVFVAVEQISIYDPLDEPREIAPGVVEAALQPQTTYVVALMSRKMMGK